MIELYSTVMSYRKPTLKHNLLTLNSVDVKLLNLKVVWEGVI